MNKVDVISVLLVEDDLAVQKLVKSVLMEMDIPNEVHVESSVEDAFVYLERCKIGAGGTVVPNFILLDLRMPRIGGKEFLRRIKADKDMCAIPVVIITASEAESDIRDCYKLHAAGYIVKSSNLDKFRQDMERLAGY